MDRYGCNGDGRRIDGRVLVRGNGDGDSGLYMEEEEPPEEEEEDDDDDEEYEEDEDEEEEEDEEMYGKEDGDEAGIGEGNIRTREGEEEDSSDSGGIAPPSTKIRKRGGLSAVELELGVKVAASRVSRGFGAMAADSRVSRDFGSSALEMGVTTAAAARVSKDFAGSELGAMAAAARLSRDSGASERGGMAGSSRVSRDFGGSELAAMAADSRVSVHGLVNEHVEEWGLRVPDEFGDVNFVPDGRKSGEGMALEENPPPPPKRKPPAPDSNGTTAAKKPKKKTVNVWAKSSTSRKSGKKGNNKGNGAQRSSLANGSAGDAAYLAPLYKNPEKLDDDPKLPILLSRIYRGEKAELSADRLSVGSTKGYRMVRATRGVSEGAWYFEVSIDHLGPTGHTRLGWSTMKGDLQAPVGFDRHSYAYRDVDGSKVHMALREPYACSYFEGDVIGFYISLPNGAALAPKGYPWFHESKDDQIPTVPGSEILFFHNGVCQGTAYTDITAGRYYPAASMYTLPNQPNCTVSFNFGPSFKFPPLDIGDRLKPEPMSKAPYLSLDGKEMAPMSNGESFGEDQVTKPHNIGESKGFA